MRWFQATHVRRSDSLRASLARSAEARIELPCRRCSPGIAPLLFRDSGREPEFRRLTIAERLPVFQGRFPLLLRADAQPSVRLLVSEEAAN